MERQTVKDRVLIFILNNDGLIFWSTLVVALILGMAIPHPVSYLVGYFVAGLILIPVSLASLAKAWEAGYQAKADEVMRDSFR